MKKIITLFTLFLSCTAFSQSFSLYQTDINAVNTATITNGSYINESTSASTLKVTWLKIKNNAAVTQSFNVTRSVISQAPMLDLSAVPSAPTTYFCFGNNCFTPPVSTPSNSDYTVLLASGQTNSSFPLADNTKDNNQPFSIDLDEGPSTGSYVVKYKIFNVANANDTLAFFIAYNQPSGIKYNNADNSFALTVFPNPVKDQATVLFNGLNNSEVKLMLTNSVGQLVYNKEHKIESNKVSLDCKDLAPGIYIVTLESGQKFQTTKLVITK